MFSDFLMTEYGLISIFKVRIMYGLKTAKILVRVYDGVRVTFKIEVRVRNPYPYPYSGVWYIPTYTCDKKLPPTFIWVLKFDVKLGFGEHNFRNYTRYVSFQIFDSKSCLFFAYIMVF